VFGQILSEIPPNPPLKKGGRSETRLYEGDFWPGPGFKEKSWLLVASLPIYETVLKIDQSRTFRTKCNFPFIFLCGLCG